MQKLLIQLICFAFLLSLSSCQHAAESTQSNPFIVILGNAQDGGYPHINCKKECCKKYYSGAEEKHFVSCIAVMDPVSNQRFLFDCTPDFPAQLHLLDSIASTENMIDGIFLTHAHIGHYTGLMYLGRESMNATNVKVYAMPEMNSFLQTNGPWSLLVQLKNIALHKLKADSTIHLNERITVTPFLVPHRHEFTETAGYKIQLQNKSVIFIPDIDKWATWNHDILQLIKENDLLLLDGTFFHDGEIAGRNMNEIPHPFIEESMKLFENLSKEEKSKIYFIHLNHTNPALINNSQAQKEVEQSGFHVARQGQRIFFH
ncbi:MAG: MBL fold metallo-hydrolase [Chitinophagaceae bacterium]|nr:MBL fold metallo-hydrolase [Chitinophagaceae bacterium]